MRRALLAALFLAAVAGGASLWPRPASSPPAGRGPAERGAGAAQISLGLREGRIVLRHKGLTQAEILAGRVSISADLRYARLTGITRATIYDHGRPAIELAAREIVMDRRTSDLEIRGPVTVLTAEGHRLTAPSARWHHAAQQVDFPQGVRITRGRDEIRAGSLVVDSAAQTFELAGGVEIAFSLEPLP